MAVIAAAAAAAAQAPLTSTAAIRGLSGERAARHLPVRLTAMVLAYNPKGSNGRPELVVYQNKTGLRARLNAPISGLMPGTMVDIWGVTGYRNLHPILLASGLRRKGIAPLPPASLVSLVDLHYGSMDSQWVRVQGVADRFDLVPGGAIIELVKRNDYIQLHVAGVLPKANWLGAKLNVRGAVLNSWRRAFWSTELFSTGPEISILHPGPAHPFALPLTPLGAMDLQLRAFPQMVHVRGIVTVQQPWGALTIQDQDRGLYATGRHLPQLRLCQQVDLAGFPTRSGQTVILQSIQARAGPDRACPTPIPLGAGDRLDAALYDRRVKISGRLEAIHVRPKQREQSLTLRSGDRMFYVDFAWPGAGAWAGELRPGMKLRVVGAFYATIYAGAPDLGVYPASPADIQILAYPTWWTGQRLRWLLWLILAALSLALAGALVFKLQTRKIARLVEIRTQEQRELERKLQQSRQLEALGRLTAGVAHDFNNMLTIILGRTELLLSHPRDADSQQQLQIIAESSQRAARLTRQLLAYGRRQAFRLECVDLNVVVSGLQEMLCALLGDNIHIRFQLASRLDCVMLDSSQFSQVIMNLAANARDAMPQGGQFEITTDNCMLTAADAALYGALPPGKYVRLQVRDTGVGMPPQVRDHVFEPFFSTKSDGQGTGLGLASAYGIITQSQGGIRVESEPGRGTVFFIVLPCAGALQAAKANA